MRDLYLDTPSYVDCMSYSPRSAHSRTKLEQLRDFVRMLAALSEDETCVTRTSSLSTSSCIA